MIGLYVIIGLAVLRLLILAIPMDVAFEFAVPGTQAYANDRRISY